MPALQSLARTMPGWSYIASRNPFTGQEVRRSKPVTFESFSTILGEFEREYECKLSELQENGVFVVLADDDFDAPEAPEPSISYMELGTRNRTHFTRMAAERQRARSAVERAILLAHSFELYAPFTVQMSCLHRATMDLRAQLSVAADAISCMPKIWDSVTSIHDRKSTKSQPR